MKSLSKTQFSIVSVWSIVFLFALTPFFIHAQGPVITGGGTVVQESGSGNCEQGKLCNPIGSVSLADFLGKVASAVLKIGVPIAAVFIIFSGLKFVMAAGDTKAIEDAKRIFWYTIIGTAILLGASALAKILETTINSVAS